MFNYAWKDLVRNPRRTLATLVGVTLGVGLFSAILFFIDGAAATMTQRALAPLALDMQWVSTSPLGGGLTLEQRIVGRKALREGDRARMTLIVRNKGFDPAHEVVVRDEPPQPLVYVPGTTKLNGQSLRDDRDEIPLSRGPAGSGLNIGTVPRRTTIRLTYAVYASRDINSVDDLDFNGTISSREDFVPVPANLQSHPSLQALKSKLQRIPGVAAADELSFVDLPPGSLRAPGSVVTEVTRVFSFSPIYTEHYPSIRIASGSLRQGSGILSAEASRSLATTPGELITLRLPGRSQPLSLSVSGVADLGRAKPLFYSRRSDKLEDFLYVRHSLIVPPTIFRDEILPALRTARAQRGDVIRALPVREVDVLVDREELHSDPKSALAQTKAIARAVEVIAPSGGYLIDNISNVLRVAEQDASVGQRMFLFLGLPGLVLAAFLTSYAGSVLASTQRKEFATLRVRGASRTHFRRLLLYRTVLLGTIGALFGVGTGLLSALLFVSPRLLFEASRLNLIRSALVAAGIGTVATAVALYIPGHNSLGRQVNDERVEFAAAEPAWRRLRLDLILLGTAVLAEALAYRAGAFDPPDSSVSAGEAVEFPLRLLVAPLVAWLGGTLLFARIFVATASRLWLPHPPQPTPLLRGTLTLSLRRRAWTVTAGVTGLGLVMALGVSLVLFSTAYRKAKEEDARFVIGSDLRITPSPLSSRSYRFRFASQLEVGGLSTVSPVVSKLENAVLIGRNNQDRADLTAIDPESFGRVAPLSDSFFSHLSASAAMAALDTNSRGVLVEAETADNLGIERKDRVQILLARGTRHQTIRRFEVLDVFTHMPGFPQQTSLVVNLKRYGSATGLTKADFFLGSSTDRSIAGLRRAVAALRAGPARRNSFSMETRKTALGRDQSSLTALNVNGLLSLNSFYTVLMSIATIAMFVFGLMLHRRKEYVTLLAHGLQIWKLQLLILGEAAVVALFGMAIGIVVGVVKAFLLVYILRPLFLLDPEVSTVTADLRLMLIVVVLTTLTTAILATALLRRMKPSEILREG